MRRDRLRPLALNAGPVPLKDAYDVAVIGGGIVGLCLGWRLAERGMSVVVLDHGEPGAAASGANAGTLALQNKRSPQLAFYREAIEEWRRLAATLGPDAVGYQRPGGLHVATSVAEAATLRAIATAHERAGTALAWLEGSALRAHAPWLGPAVPAATWLADDAYANPLLVGPALVRIARAAGAEILGHAPVESVTCGHDGYGLQTPLGLIRCRIAAIAAGAWSERVGALFSLRLPIRSSVIVLSVSEPSPPYLPSIITHVGGRLTVKQVPNGTTLIGGGWPGRGSLATGALHIQAGMLRHNLAFAASVVPRLAQRRLTRSWAGFEIETPDSLPIAGALDRRKTVFAAVPAAAGFSAGPLLARLVADAILDGEMPELGRQLDPGRFER
ncbi:MAG: FAD-dependent oxidoreductase [Alphaproteobacteria bacterium]